MNIIKNSLTSFIQIHVEPGCKMMIINEFKKPARNPCCCPHMIEISEQKTAGRTENKPARVTPRNCQTIKRASGVKK